MALAVVAFGAAEQLHDIGLRFPTRSLAGGVEGLLAGKPAVPERASLEQQKRPLHRALRFTVLSQSS